MQMRNSRVWVLFGLFILLIVGIVITWSAIVRENAQKGQATDLQTILFAPFVALAEAPSPAPAGLEMTVIGSQSSNGEVLAKPSEAGKQQAFTPVVDAWAAPPECENDPLNAAEWQKALADPANAGSDFNGTGQINAAVERAALLAPAVDALPGADAQEVANALMAPGSDALAEARTALLLNVASGRLNRATEISLPELPQVKTVGDLLDRAAGGPAAMAPSAKDAAALSNVLQKVQAGIGITRSVCAHVLVSQVDQPLDSVMWASDGIRAQALAQGAAEESIDLSNKVVGSGIASPDGRWAAFVSGGNDVGGPVLLYNLQSKEWLNLIQRINARPVKGESGLNADSFWSVIGWFPDSQRLMIAALDFSAVQVVDINSGDTTVIPLDGGFGSPSSVGLAPDGSRFVYIGTTEGGAQAFKSYSFIEETTSILMEMPYTDGILQNPRISPDGRSLAFVVQKGLPTTGVTYSIQVYDFETRAASVVIEGGLGPTVPAWSPDSRSLAFTRKDQDEPDIVSPDAPSAPAQGNVWVISVADGQSVKMTYLSGLARDPQWSNDGKTISFLTQIGQVGLVSIDQPGKIWEASPSSVSFPLFTSAFFLP